MRFENVTDVKKWFRSIILYKRELELKLEFYRELLGDFKMTGEFENSINYYKKEIENIQKKLEKLMADKERMLALLDNEERLIMTARYINMIKWDYMELQVYYSRRQAIRIHDRAVLKLVGQKVGD